MARESKVSCIILVWAPRKWGPSFLLEVRPIPSSHLQRAREPTAAPILRPTAARPPCKADEATRGRIYRTKRDTDQTPTPANIAPKTALTESQRPPRAHLAPTAAHDSRPASEALGGQPPALEA